MDINILITDDVDSKIEPTLFDDCAHEVFSKLKAGFDNCEISLVITDDKRIQKLNKQFRDKDSATDVLSFPMDDEPVDGSVMLGDIVISLETAQRQADEAAILLKREIAFLFIHGVLHLLGFDHEEGPDEEEEMFDLQEGMLRNLLENGKVP
ncbi:MAG: rRNA maturation RNase YbeY [Denitrovibrio sp.]|nr:MAG: rRNA maturation RNase YbeY [Denitrovibrio sp.]